MKLYEVITTSGLSLFLNAESAYINNDGYLIFRSCGEVIGEFNFANIAGYRITR